MARLSSLEINRKENGHHQELFILIFFALEEIKMNYKDSVFYMTIFTMQSHSSIVLKRLSGIRKKLFF